MSLAVTVDKPNRNGRVTVQGYGRSWSCADPRAGGEVRSGTVGWWFDPTVEHIPEVGGIAPAGVAAPAAMSLGAWSVVQGSWKIGPGGGYLPAAPLMFADGSTGGIAGNSFGIIQSAATWEPYLKLWLWRFPGSTDTEQPLFMLELDPAGNNPSYAIVLPTDGEAAGGGVDYLATLTGVADGAFRGPLLLGKAHAERYWTIIDEWRGGRGGGMAGRHPNYTEMTIEIVGADWLLVRMAGADEGWLYRGDWRSVGGAAVEWAPFLDYTVRLYCMGQTAALSLAPITYAVAGRATPTMGVYAGEMIEPTAQYKVFATYSGAPGDNWTVMQDGTPPLTRPLITFKATAPARPFIYSVEEYRDATIGDVSTDPATSALGGTFEVNWASGEIDRSYRDNRCTVEVVAIPGSVPNLFTFNSHLLVQSSPDEVNYYNHFWGRITGHERVREDPLGRVVQRLEGADEWWRFGRKRMAWHCCYAGWAIPEAVLYVLERWGVPSSLVTVHPDVSPGTMGDAYYLPLAPDEGGKRPLQFADDATGDEALDAILKCRDLELQALLDGTFHLLPRQSYGGTPDFTLDLDTCTGDELLLDVRATRNVDEFINALFVTAGSGAYGATRLMWDTLTQAEPSILGYVGDDFWEVEEIADGDEEALIRASKAIWAKRWVLHGSIYLNTCGNRDLMPEQWIQISNLPDLGLIADSIWQITRKAWREDAREYRQTLELTPKIWDLGQVI